ncbi:Coq4 family protein [Leptolyngbya ohadii]|uniref:Coq4 family protein n=1 Tax=Leptolyngbya ohadii TaxID=1962290 RepID=UPI000B5986C2|nr:Coq4 family protein [Leptolyngbya ohadii]
MQSSRSSTHLPTPFPKTVLQPVLQTARGIKAFVTLLFDESGSLEPVWELSNSLLDSPAFHLAIASLKTMPEVAAILTERYMTPPYDLDELLQCPEGSLGYEYASQMKQHGFKALEPAIAIDSDTHYIEHRWQKTHDIWHVITGFDVSDIGEIGLQAFYLAQFQLPLSSLLIANALIASTVLQPESLNPLLDAIAQGYQMGKVAQPLIGQKWETAWDKPVTQWRKQLNVQPVGI